jgi:uncharacterized protein DUF2783
MTLRLEPTFTDPDRFYAALVQANDGLSDAESHSFSLRLLLLLANQIGDGAILDACIAEAAKPHTEGTDNG